MRAFCSLIENLDLVNSTNAKVAALTDYFRMVQPADGAWAIYFLTGNRPKRLVKSGTIRTTAAKLAGLEDWLFEECYGTVGDLAETVALLLGSGGQGAERSLAETVEQVILPFQMMPEEEKAAALEAAWRALGTTEKFVFNKLLTGGFRVGVSKDLVVRALAEAFDQPITVIASKLTGIWQPTAENFEALREEEGEQTVTLQPYPFCLAHPLTDTLDSLGAPHDWQLEWKWDGIRSQVVARGGSFAIWSRGEDLVTEQFPELGQAFSRLPDGTVLDGELLAYKDGKPLNFLELQKRLGRKTVGKKTLEDVPVIFVAYDLLECSSASQLNRSLFERRQVLEEVIGGLKSEKVVLSEVLSVESWEQGTDLMREARARSVEGLMLKRRDSIYGLGRKKGLWYKYKVEPMVVDAVLMYAQQGHGRRAGLYTDYTFGVWGDDGVLVPIAKAYSGLNNAEITEVDKFIRASTLERFGPVRTVKPELVMEIAFEQIQLSSRHKSGIAVRFPRINRWRKDKPASEADTLASVKQLLVGKNETGPH